MLMERLFMKKIFLSSRFLSLALLAAIGSNGHLQARPVPKELDAACSESASALRSIREACDLLSQEASDNSFCAETCLALRQALTELAEAETPSLELLENAKALTEVALQEMSPEKCAQDGIYRRKTTRLLCEIRRILCCCCHNLEREIAAGNEALSKQIAAGFQAVEEGITNLAEEIAIGFENVLERLPCTPPVAIDSVPFTITAPGTYCLLESVTYTGSGAAITISGVSNVKLNLENASITLTDPAAVGILIINSSEVVVQNDAISATAPSLDPASAAIQVVDSSKVIIDNVLTVNTAKGIWIQGSDNVRVSNSHLLLHSLDLAAGGPNGAIRAEGSRNIDIVNTVAENSIFGAALANGTRNVHISNSKFYNNAFNLFLRDGENVLIENSELLTDIADAPFLFNNIQIGTTAGLPFNNIIIKDSILSNTNPAPGFDNIIVLFGAGLKIENCILSTAGAILDGNGPAIVHLGIVDEIGDPLFVATDVFISNSILHNTIPGTTAHIVRSETGSSRIVINNSLLSGASLDGVNFVGATQSRIENSEISANGGNGIAVAGASSSNVIINNQISGNALDGVALSVGLTVNNLVQNNQVLGNGGIGIEDAGSANQVYYNSAFNNGGGDYAGVPGALVGAPGSFPVTLGQNIAA
jgi:parallel beta-helix repeat protein